MATGIEVMAFILVEFCEEIFGMGIRAAIGPLSGRSLKNFSDDCLKRYLEGRDWNVDKSKKMLEETLKWRSTYKPEEIRWNTSSIENQMRHLVYLLENATLDLPQGRHIHFKNLQMASVEIYIYIVNLSLDWGGTGGIEKDVRERREVGSFIRI